MSSEQTKDIQNVVLTGTVEREEDQFVSFCPELGVSSCGDTVEEALDNLGDALEVHLNALEELGEIERVFRERNIEVRPGLGHNEQVSVMIPANRTVRAYSKAVSLPSIR